VDTLATELPKTHQRGDLKRADEHLEKARWLSEHGRD
jgi:hypothetical protein